MMDSFICAVCTKDGDMVAGQTWYGDPVCGYCAATFEQCAKCAGYIEPKDITERDSEDLPLCPECLKGFHDGDRCERCERIIVQAEDRRDFNQLGHRWSECRRCYPRTVPAWHANRTKVRKHPAVLGSEALDKEMQARLERDP